MGLLMEQYVVQPLRLRRGGGEVDGRAEKPEQARGGKALLYQIDRKLTVGDTVRDSCFAEFAPKTQVHCQEEDPCGCGSHGPHRREDLREGPFVGVPGDGLAVVGEDRIAEGFRRGNSLTRLDVLGGGNGVRRGPVQGQDIDLPVFQLRFHLRIDVLGSGEHGEIHCRQIYRDQKAHQHQCPQCVLDPAGDGLAERLTQDQQQYDQYRGCHEDFAHVCSPPARSKIAVSSAMSSSVRACESTMALIIKPSRPL